jgi:carbamoyl-phosphate synthase large subunit
VISRAGVTFMKVVGVCAAAAVGFMLLQHGMRTLEMLMSLRLLSALGVDDVRSVGPTTLLVVPYQRAAFHVLITPSCSSIASVLAFGCLAPLVPSRSVAAKVSAVASAVALIVGGNVVRITASIGMGLFAGRGSLVLFHDWVGSMFTVVYTLTGYVLMLSFVLPRQRRVAAALAV